jgi:hypothetical protein
MKSELHKHVRVSVLIGWVIAWNVLLGTSVWLNGGLGRAKVPSAAWPTALALVGSCGFCILLLLSRATQSWALRPTGQLSAIRQELWFIVLLTGGMGAATLYGLLSTPSA